MSNLHIFCTTCTVFSKLISKFLWYIFHVKKKCLSYEDLYHKCYAIEIFVQPTKIHNSVHNIGMWYMVTHRAGPYTIKINKGKCNYHHDNNIIKVSSPNFFLSIVSEQLWVTTVVTSTPDHIFQQARNLVCVRICLHAWSSCLKERSGGR